MAQTEPKPQQQAGVPSPSVIRSRLEQTALQDCLKPSMGGYTKKSVQEYVLQLRRQQQLVSENFNLEMKRMLDEKEQLASENRGLAERLERTEADYRNLTQTIANCRVEDTEYTLDDVIALKTALETAQAGAASLQDQLSRKEQQIARLTETVQAREADAARAAQETRTCRELLASEQSESAALRQSAARLNAKLDEQKAQLDYLSGVVSDGSVAELNAKLDAAEQNASLQEELIAHKNAQLDSAKQEAALLAEQLSGLRDTAARLTEAADQLTLQNEKLTAANAALISQLDESLARSVALLSEKAQLNAEKLLAERRLDALRLKRANEAAGVSPK